MQDVQTVLAIAVGIVAALAVPLLVWIAVVAGLVRIVREKAREGRRKRTGLLSDENGYSESP